MIPGQFAFPFGSHLLEAIGKLAPLSIVLAALGLLFNLMQARAKRNRDEADRVRELLNKLGTKAYLLIWSLTGDSDISAGVLRIRELVESRIGTSPSGESLNELLHDRLLFESIVQKAWRESGVTAQFQQQALEFGKIRADLGNRIPLIQAALEVVDTKLRMLFLVNIFVVSSIRNDSAYQNIAREKQQAHHNSMMDLHRLLVRAAKSSDDKDAFPQACELLQEFSSVTATASDKRLLNLLHQPRLFLQLLREAWRDNREQVSIQRSHQQLLQNLKARFPEDFEMLWAAADAATRTTGDLHSTERRLKNSFSRVAAVLSGSEGFKKLNDAAHEFLAAYMSHNAKNITSTNALLQLKSSGVVDPDVDLLIGAMTGVTQLAQSALSRGANADVRLHDVFVRHKQKAA